MPSTVQPAPTTLNVVLLALQAKLIAALTFPAERVLLLARDGESHRPQADQYVSIRSRAQRWDRSRTGAGRFDNRVRRRLTVTLSTRLLLDESSEDTDWMTHATLGHFVTEQALFDALEMWQPTNDDGDVLLFEPVHLEEATQAEKLRTDEGWGDAAYSFDACFVLDLDQTVQ